MKQMYNVLLVEDEPLIRQGIRKLVEQLGQSYSVVKEACSGAEAWDFVRSQTPDLIITDIRMRDMDGLSFIRKVREIYGSLPILIVSGYDEFRYAQQALRSGVFDYLLKPVDRLAFVAALEKIRDKLDTANGGNASESGRTDSEPAAEGGSAELKGNHTIRKVKEFIAANLEGDVGLQATAESVQLHPAYLSHLFKQETGENLSDYITALRMERAKQLLTQTQLKIYDVARLSGYQSPKHFMLVFKQQVGVTPVTYRESRLH